jgi:pimeloyl-ACP methyl ester carboxylesterase
MSAVLPEHHPFRSAEARDRYLADYDRRVEGWPLPSETKMLRTDQGGTFVRISGPADGPPLVMLTGLWSDSLMWPPAMVAALSERYRTFAVDNPWDFGRSVNARATTSRNEYVAWLGALLDGLGLNGDVSILALSLGVWIAAEYVLREPGRIAKMVWMSPGGVVGSAYSLSTLPGIPRMSACMFAPSTRTVGALMGGLMKDSATSADPAVRREFEEYVEAVALGLQCFSKRPVTLETNRRFSDAELHDMPMPVLYMAGEHETFCSPPKTVARLAAVAPGIETEVFSDCGHDLISLKTEAATRRMLAFLGS